MLKSISRIQILSVFSFFEAISSYPLYLFCFVFSNKTKKDVVPIWARQLNKLQLFVKDENCHILSKFSTLPLYKNY